MLVAQSCWSYMTFRSLTVIIIQVRPVRLSASWATRSTLSALSPLRPDAAGPAQSWRSPTWRPAQTGPLAAVLLGPSQSDNCLQKAVSAGFDEAADPVAAFDDVLSPGADWLLT
jgi:hypothetical protein